jgi:hypothetical protein
MSHEEKFAISTLYIQTVMYNSKSKVKGKGDPRTGHEFPEVE